MIHREFCTVLAYLAAGCGKQLSDAATEVYWDCLGDMDYQAFSSAAKRVLMEHPWATFPSIAELRKEAVSIQAGKSSTMPAQEAWSIAWRAAGKIDPDQHGEFITYDGAGNRIENESMTAYALADVPPHVVAPMRTFGMSRLIAGIEPIGVMQAQFCQTYSALQLTAQRDALLPASLRADIERIGSMPQGIAEIEAIGNPQEFASGVDEREQAARDRELTQVR